MYLVKVTRNRASGLLPVDADGQSEIAKLGDGEIARFTMLRPRNLPQFRRWWAIMDTIAENTGRDKDSVCNEIKILAGFYEVLPIEGAEGYQVRTPKSIRFDKLDEDGWQAVLPKLEAAGIERFGSNYFVSGSW